MTGPSLESPLGALADVTDASRLLECHQAARQLRFQHLVRCYLSQILYGCKSAYCTTPTCLSCNKRLVTKPHRPPTQLTARSFAYYLASQDRPHRGLCPHELKVDPDTLGIDCDDGVNGHREGVSVHSRRHGVFDRAAPKPTDSQTNTADDGDGDGKPSTVMTLAEAIAKRRQTKKDPKSLGQNLYDTATMIFFYSKHIPHPNSVFASLQSSNTSNQQSLAETARLESLVAPLNKGSRDSSHAALTTQPNSHDMPTSVNGHVSSPEAVKSKTQHVSSPSLSNDELWPSGVFRGGHYVHKIRHVPNMWNENYPSRKTVDISPLDGTVDGVRTAKSKMKWHAGAVSQPTHSEGNVRPPNPSIGQANHHPSHSGRLSIQVASHLTCDIMDRLKEDVFHHRDQQSDDFNFAVDYDGNRQYRTATPFVNRSLFFSLSDPETLLKSFKDKKSDEFADSPLPCLDSYRMANAFRDWSQRNGALIFDSLYVSVDALFRPPPELNTQKSPRLKPSRKGATPQEPSLPDITQDPTGRYLSDEEAVHITMVCIHALTSLVPDGWPHTWVQVRKFRGWGVVVPGATPNTDFTDRFQDPWLNIVDELEYEPAVRLASRLLRGISARLCFEEVLSNLKGKDHEEPGSPSSPKSEQPTPKSAFVDLLVRHLEVVERNAISRKAKMKVVQDTNEDPGWTVTATFMEWLRTIIVKEWDGKATIRKWTAVGGAFALLAHFYLRKSTLNLRRHMFYIPYLNERIDEVQAPMEFVGFQPSPNFTHILEYPFLFSQEYLVGYFRTINFTTMLTQIDHSTRTVTLQSRLGDIYNHRYDRMIRSQLKVPLKDYLVLQVSRENALKETLDQLWGQEKRLLLKPLKVRVGTLEGEVGFDQGGVTCEFFRFVLTEAFKTDNGMFTVDPETRMTWFQPASFEPDWKFQMLGVLFSLAVYNGVTLPVTFPLTVYEHLLAKDVYSYSKDLNTDAIREGWPMLAKSFDELLSYDGEVADIYMRDYVFSFEAFGHVVNVDMQAFEGHKRWPARNSPPHPDRFENASAWRASLKRPALSDAAWFRPTVAKSETDEEFEDETEAAPVTNANRERFVKDYIHWLVHRSVERQLSAFAAGLYTCLNRRSLDLFTPQTLRELVEGNPIISVPLLRKATRYQGGYTATHQTIVDFWSIVESYSQAEVKRLLEFVTASERVPITGFEGMSFVIDWHGGDTELLPTSSTCFGKLYLPEYSDKEKMRGKLELALQNCEGFGNA